ncbi:WD repeat and SOCS box-containing protein 1 [Rhizoctonia solani]|uniref:WD repeat and SOCS box-containing protein 1 n=1 Tax=Rhizoctonia solani TaxID=456999 RepID=A0A0K6FT44_9AGAM|nr:WD repeat and SOCS box-containing protein 1 [Rhizoctonia solani]
MHFLKLRMKMLLLSIVIFVPSFLGLVAAIPVDTPWAIEAPVEAGATHLASRKSSRGGWATYYDTEGGRGACGNYNHNRELVVAIGKPLWDSTQGRSGASTLCGKTGTVKWRGKSVRVRVVDECPVCGYNDIDLSPSAFQKLADKGHSKSLKSTAFSPDGKLIVSASDDHTLRIWDAQTGSLTARPFQGHTESVNSAIFSPDGTCIASGSRDHTILIWDAPKGKILVGPLEGHTDWVWSVAFSPDGTRIASGSKDRTVRIWNADTGALIGEPSVGHSDTIFSVAFSPDGTRVVSGSRDKTIRIWDAYTGKTVVGPLEGHLDWAWSVSVSPDGTRIASGSRDFTIRVWDAQTGNMIAGPFNGHYSPVFSVAFSPDGTRIISGARNGVVYIWDAHNGLILLSLFGENNGAIRSANFSPDGKRILYGCGNSTAIVQTRTDTEAPMVDHISNKDVFDQLVEHGCIDMTPTIDPDGYSTSSVYGNGFGDLWKGRLTDGTDVAVKTWRFSFMSQEDPKQLKRAMKEVYNWTKVKHENIQELLGVAVFQERLSTVSPWMAYGNLGEYVSGRPDTDRYALCVQVATGLSHLHKEGMVHGDLRATNVLVSKDGILKLGNFDQSILAESTMVLSNATNLTEGTLRWMAPELLMGKDPDDESDQPVKRDKRTDVYALGMTFLEIITGRVPYAELETDYSVFGALQNKQRPTRPKELLMDNPKQGTTWRLLLWCWDYEPAGRPRAVDVLVMLSGLAGT